MSAGEEKLSATFNQEGGEGEGPEQPEAEEDTVEVEAGVGLEGVPLESLRRQAVFLATTSSSSP